MKSTLKMLSAIMFSVNVMGNHEDENIKSLYDGVLNKAHQPYALDSWIDAHFSDSFTYCAANRCVENKKEIKEILREKYFGNSNLIKYKCDYENEKEFDISINCDFTFLYTDKFGAECERTENHEIDINYCASGTITTYVELTHNEPVWWCKGIPEYVDPDEEYTCTIKPTDNYLTSDQCYNTADKNPCDTKREPKIYYYPSCTGCCNYIQCDDFGKAFDRPCVPGTGWDQSVLTCTREGQCSVVPTTTTTTEAPTHGYTPKPTTTTTKAPTKPIPCPTTTTTKAPTPGYTPKPTATTTKAPTKWPTAKPTNQPTPEPTPEPTDQPTSEPTPQPTTTTSTTKAPTKWPTAKPTPQPTEEPTKSPTTPKTTPCPTTTTKPTNAPTTWTKSPTKNPTTTTTTAKPTNAPTVWTKSPSKNPTPAPSDGYVKTPKPTPAPSDGYVRTPKPTPAPTDGYVRTPTPAPTDGYVQKGYKGSKKGSKKRLH